VGPRVRTPSGPAGEIPWPDVDRVESDLLALLVGPHADAPPRPAGAR